MIRILLLVVVIAVGAATGARAQLPGQYNPATPTLPSPPLPSTPPAATPGLTPIPPILGKSSRQGVPNTVPRLEVGRAARASHGDRAIRCNHQAVALGVPPGQIGQYTQQCADAE